MSGRILLAAGLVTAVALTAYLSWSVGPGANAAPAPTIATERPSADAVLVSPDLPVRAAVSSEPEPATVAAGPVDAAPGDEPDATVAPSGALIAGLALDPNDAPLVAAEIWLVAAVDGCPPWLAPLRGCDLGAPRSTRTDEGGRFEFPEVAPGTWWVGPASPDGPVGMRGTEAVLPIAETVEISGGQTRADIVLRCKAALWIQGSVVGPDDLPVSDASVEARNPTEAAVPVSAHPNMDGSYAVGPLPSGACLIRARPFRVRTELAPSEEIWVAAGTADVELRLARGGLLRGTIVDPEAPKPWMADVRAWRSGTRQLPDSWGARSYWADASRQTFEFDALAPGEYDVVATGQGGRIGVLDAVNIAAGAEPKEVSIEMARGGTIRPLAESRHAGCHVRLESRGVLIGWTIPSGKGTILAPEGRATVALVGPDGTIVAEKTVDVVAGGRQDVVFD